MWQMVASQVVISPKKAGKGDNLWWPESKDEKYKGCGSCNGHLMRRGDGLGAERSLRCTEEKGPRSRGSFGSREGIEPAGLLHWTGAISVLQSGRHVLFRAK